SLDRKAPLMRSRVLCVLDRSRLVLTCQRVAAFEGTHDVRIGHPPIAALRIFARECTQDDMLAGNHEPPPPHLARIGCEITLGAVAHPAGDYKGAPDEVEFRKILFEIAIPAGLDRPLFASAHSAPG